MILTTHYDRKMPALITHDSRGTEIKPGALVAFNKSGAIEIGIIRDFSSRWKSREAILGTGNKTWFNSVFHMAIINNRTPHEISHIKNPNSFIILTEDIFNNNNKQVDY